MNFKIKLQRIYIKYLWDRGKRFPLKNKLTNDENKFISIIKKNSILEDVEILSDVIMNKRYIVNRNSNIYIIMDNVKIILVSKNIKMSYYFDYDIINHIWDFTSRQITKKRNKLEKEIEEIVDVSLDNILKNM